MDDYVHGREHADLCNRLDEACALIKSHLLEHEGLAVPHHSHTSGDDISEALHDLATDASEPVTEGAEAEESPAEESAEEAEESAEETAEHVEETAEHPETVDPLISPADEGRDEGEPKRAHPIFTRVFGS